MDRQAENDRLQRERLDKHDQWMQEDRKQAREQHQLEYLGKMDAQQRAQAKEQFEVTGKTVAGILSLPENEQGPAYEAAHQALTAQGYKINLPSKWSPSLKPQLQAYAVQVPKYLEMLGNQPTPMGALGGAPTPGGAPAGGPPGDVMSRAGNAIGGIESGGNYAAVGPDTGGGNKALGKYQVMASNVPSWTAEILGKPLSPQEFLASPDAQEAVFKGKFGQYVQKYGPEGASKAWFAGEGGMNNPDAKDVLGTSVASYAQKFNKGFGGPQVADAGGFTPTSTPAQSIPGALPQIAQGDAVAGQGDVMAPPRAAPPAVEERKFLHQHVPPGYSMLGVHGKPFYDPQGRLGIIQVGPDGRTPIQGAQPKFIDVPKPEAAPAGYRSAPTGGLEPIPGGPADPARVRAEKVPSGYRDNGDGTYTFIPGGPADPAIVKRASPMNNEQARDAGFADRMMQAEDVLSKVEGEGGSTLGRLSEKTGIASGYLQSKEYQSFKQARDNFINAQLRRESGAAISADEYVKADRQYFPQPGDDPETIKQKALNRKLAVEGMVRGAGPTYQPSPSVPKPPKQLEGAERESLLFDARKAIEQGAPRDKVIQRLKEKGVEGGL